ncbi:NAD-dependent epimerase/dehydratase family protein [Arachidicoccus terrestris]|uniref:NAD-dependent epimerase/dehydratase family protein n=1 Tax=Arachidicoccus terrestris TaxID=2875539 RepID=UPI001CC48099|nr:NAD-dependent epimerase/dehydratase family protein [Arachidicoccus terrestris]UAY54196.1 NAD-dependent epimerase/dehydratase family protein [Arachidicoccus terrestris]
MALICANFSRTEVESNPKETILVTGATGLIGSQILKQLDARANNVIGLARNLPENLNNDIQWMQCDLLDVVALEDALKGVSRIYHCAGLVSFDPKMKEKVYKTNVEGTANLINGAIKRGVQKLVHVSSVAAIGEAKGAHTVIHEKLEWNAHGVSDYAKSKHLAEIEVWRGLCEGLSSVIINPSIVIGPGNWDTGSTAMFKSVYDGFPWYTEGVHGFVDVRDVASVAIELMQSPIVAERFIVNGANISYKELFDNIADGFSVPRPAKKVTPFLAEIVWRIKYVKSKLLGVSSILNKNTARTALAVCKYDASKLRKALPGFNYRPIKETIMETCQVLKGKYDL